MNNYIIYIRKVLYIHSHCSFYGIVSYSTLFFLTKTGVKQQQMFIAVPIADIPCISYHSVASFASTDSVIITL